MAKTQYTLPRILWLDIARSLAVLGMVIYHFTFDLAMFGFIAPYVPVSGFWAVFARAVAGSFLLLAGFSLVLMHGQRIAWPRFWRRLAIVVGAALLITLTTWVVMPTQFIFFGILHSIALCSLLGLAFLRLPWAVTLLVAVVFLVVPQVYRDVAFNTPVLLWVGLAPDFPPTMDYEPVFPWFGAFLLGVVFARVMLARGALPQVVPSALLSRLTWPGRHSLVIYLVHQPVLIGLFNLYVWFR
ncbi:heparan-alpha-glucosaminide N-acetyltransferase, partial [Pseudorhodobacter ferrugineus]|uniref:heparan-alpha-glucosaminide N-acetyltransferase n=1 Tax=Pseudorhodobacter ferrugineus TaxID=77008 RepID=UPI0003B58CC4